MGIEEAEEEISDFHEIKVIQICPALDQKSGSVSEGVTNNPVPLDGCLNKRRINGQVCRRAFLTQAWKFMLQHALKCLFSRGSGDSVSIKSSFSVTHLEDSDKHVCFLS